MFPYTVIRIMHEQHTVDSVAMFADYDEAAAYCISALDGWTFEATTFLILENNDILYKESYIPSER